MSPFMHTLKQPNLSHFEQQRKTAALFLKLSAVIAFLILFCLFTAIHGFISTESFGPFQIAGYVFYAFSHIFYFIITKNILLKLARKRYEGKNRAIEVAVISALTAVISAAAAFFAGRYYFSEEIDGELFQKFWTVLGSTIFFILLIIAIKLRENSLYSKIKTKLFPVLLKEIKSEAEFEPKGEINKENFILSGIYFVREHISYYKGSHLIKESKGQNTVQFCQLHVREIRGKSHKNKNRRFDDLFKGVFCMIDHESAYEHITIIRSRNVYSMLSSRLQELVAKQKTLYKLKTAETGNELFDNWFICQTDETEHVKGLFNEKLVTELVAMINLFGQDISVAWMGKKIFIAIESDYDAIVPDILDTFEDAAQSRKMENKLKFLLSLPEKLIL